VPCNFCFINFSPKRTVEAQEAPHIPIIHLYPGGGRYLPPSRTTSVPNFIRIRPGVWISIVNKQTDIALYVLGEDLQDVKVDQSTVRKIKFIY